MLYLRDLKESLREMTENQIRKDCPWLVKAMEDGADIQIGEVWNARDYKVVD